MWCGRVAISVIVGLSLVSCGQAEMGCGSESANSAVGDMLKRSIQESVRKALEVDAKLASFDRSKLATALSKAEITLNEVRTTKDDPDSSRVFCNAKISVKFPDSIFQVIDKSRNNAGLEDRAAVANRRGISHDANGYVSDIEYSVQPTDDGKKIVAEFDANTALVETISDLFYSYMLSDEIAASKVAFDEAQAQENEAKKLLSSASLEEAQAEKKMAAQRMSAVWNAIPSSTRARLSSLQSAWNKRVSAQCTVSASGTSTDLQMVNAAKARCESQAIFERSRELERFAVYNDDLNALEGAAAAAAAAAADAEENAESASRY